METNPPNQTSQPSHQPTKTRPDRPNLTTPNQPTHLSKPHQATHQSNQPQPTKQPTKQPTHQPTSPPSQTIPTHTDQLTKKPTQQKHWLCQIWIGAGNPARRFTSYGIWRRTHAHRIFSCFGYTAAGARCVPSGGGRTRGRPTYQRREVAERVPRQRSHLCLHRLFRGGGRGGLHRLHGLHRLGHCDASSPDGWWDRVKAYLSAG